MQLQPGTTYKRFVTAAGKVSSVIGVITFANDEIIEAKEARDLYGSVTLSTPVLPVSEAANMVELNPIEYLNAMEALKEVAVEDSVRADERARRCRKTLEDLSTMVRAAEVNA